MAQSACLTLEQAVPLAYAFAAHAARTVGARALSIKGPVAQAYGLRRPRMSSDVDVWVDPREFERYVAALATHGWRLRSPVEGPRILGHHSKSLIHDQWPCDIDVHLTYPGFLLPDEAAIFERLWKGRTKITVAGVEIDVPDKAGAAAVMALHALRDPDGPRNAAELSFLAGRVQDDFSDQERAKLVELACETWALDTLGPLLDGAGITRPPSPDCAEYADRLRNWSLRVNQNIPTTSWALALRRAPWRVRPRLLWEALVLPGELLSQIHPEVGQGALDRARARTARLMRGVRDMPRTIRALAFRRSERPS